jgi:transmembrane sensor
MDPTDDTPDSEALRVLVRRLDHAAWTARDEASFQHWLGSSPVNAEAFTRAENTLATLADRRLFPAGEITRVLAPRPRRRSAIAWAIPTLAAAAIVLLVFFLWPVHWAASYTTQVAERREVLLPDGTQVSLDARTTLECDFTRDARRIRLLGGRATFHVKPDASRPFTVAADDRIVRVVGTFFEVAWRPSPGPAPVRVAVTEGIVELRTRHPDGRETIALRLTAAKQSEWLTGTANPSVALLPSDSFASWRDGHLRYRDARLADVVADLAAYFPGSIELADPTLADLRVTGTLPADAPREALATLADILPLRVNPSSSGRLVLSPSPVN